MKKRLYTIILATFVLIGSASLFTSCTESENLEDIKLEAFGPCPVLRGGSISFIGSNINKITSVVFPDGIEVKDITIVSPEEISVIVPQNATTGHITLKHTFGAITTVSEIGYTEPYSISSITPKAGEKELRKGDILTINGDYLWNIVSVVFMSNAVVEAADFIDQTRERIVVPVPANAQSGKIKIVDATGNELYSDQEISVLQPNITTIVKSEVKAGELISFVGSNMDLIASVKFTGGAEVTIDENAEVSKSSLSVIVPENAQDGAVTLVAYSGFETQAPQNITMVVPTDLKIVAESRFKAGLKVQISGKDIDLVTAVGYTGKSETIADEAWTTVVLADETIIVSTIPANAIDGVINLTTASTKTVSTPAITLVKPQITALSPTAFVAGSTFEVIGEDLDLVESLTLGGKDCTFTKEGDPTKLIVQTENTSVSGKVVVKAGNGDEFESADEISLTYESLVIVTDMPASAGIDDEITITGSNFNIIENIFFGDTKVTGYVSRTDTELKFKIPDVQTGSYNMRFVLFNGDEENCPRAIDITGRVTLTTIWEGEHNIGESWSNALQMYDGSLFANVHPGSVMTIEFTQNTTATYWQLQICDGTWAPIPGPGPNEWGCKELAAGQTSFSFTLTYEDVSKLKASGFVLNGYGVTARKVYIAMTNMSVDPIKATDVMLMDFEKHGDHSGDWDSSWAGISQIINEDGNIYWRGIASMPSGSWVLNCNHQASGALGPKIDDLSQYIMKIDVKFENDIVAVDASSMSIIFAGQWNGWINDFFEQIKAGGAYTTNGGWTTISFPADSFGYTSMDCSSGDYGMFYQGGTIDATGICFDNWRFSLK